MQKFRFHSSSKLFFLYLSCCLFLKLQEKTGAASFLTQLLFLNTSYINVVLSAYLISLTSQLTARSVQTHRSYLQTILMILPGT